jgi:hypothetical protein
MHQILAEHIIAEKNRKPKRFRFGARYRNKGTFIPPIRKNNLTFGLVTTLLWVMRSSEYKNRISFQE